MVFFRPKTYLLSSGVVLSFLINSCNGAAFVTGPTSTRDGLMLNQKNYISMRHGVAVTSSNSEEDATTMTNQNAFSSSNRQSYGRRDFLALSAASALFLPVQSAFAEDKDSATTTLHIVDYPVKGKCGEANVPEKGVFFAKTFGGMVDGPCSVEGFSSNEGTANGTGEKDKIRTYNIYGK